MLIIADANTVWRQKPWEAVGELYPTLGAEPMDPLTLWRARRWPFKTPKTARPRGFQRLPVAMPFRWASAARERSMPYLWKRVETECRRTLQRPSGLVVTTPHYLPLVVKLRDAIPCFYYCSDDYQGYSGWNPTEMREMEGELIKAVEHSFFVSQALARRAVEASGVEASKASVSMNATDAAFFQPPPAAIEFIHRRYSGLPRPVAGVVGAFNERIDFEILRRCLQSSAIGSLLLIGPADQSIEGPAWDAIISHEKCTWVGTRPHAELPAWMRLLDVALIPYRRSDFNYYCSPMRLFDHLASGIPIVATAACDQFKDFHQYLTLIGEHEACNDIFLKVCGEAGQGRNQEQIEFAKAHTWAARATALVDALGPVCNHEKAASALKVGS